MESEASCVCERERVQMSALGGVPQDGRLSIGPGDRQVGRLAGR